MLEYDTKGSLRYQSIVFWNSSQKCWHRCLDSLPLYLTHVTCATRSHTTSYKNNTTSMFDCLIYMVNLELGFSILHPSPSVAIQLKSIALGLITKYHPILVFNSPMLMMFRKIQPAILILGCEQWLLLLLKWSKTWFLKCTPHCVCASHHIQVFPWSIAHFYKIIYSHEL